MSRIISPNSTLWNAEYGLVRVETTSPAAPGIAGLPDNRLLLFLWILVVSIQTSRSLKYIDENA
jgi:hypothetical protein